MIKYEEYQIELIEKIKNDFNAYLHANGNNIFLFQSPTGSGKTIVVGSVIKELSKRDNVFFIWLSIGIGSNERQSYESFINNLEFDGEDLYIFDTLDKIPEETKVVFANWSYLKAKKGKTKTSNYESDMTESNQSFIDFINNKKIEGKKIVLIVDESHHTSDSELSKSILNKISPNIFLDVTATPVKGKTYSFIYKPNETQVEKSGIIKSSISINSYTKNTNVVDEEIFILKNAEDRRKSIINEYKNYESNIVQPLVIVQCPYSKADELKNKIISLGIDSNDIAFHFDKVQINIEDVKNHNSNIKYLLCNQAIATGWDCPRAHILVQFIRVGSEKFQIQVVGRISRTAKQKLYGNTIIDTGYVLTYFDENKKYIEEYKKQKNLNIPVRGEMVVRSDEILQIFNKSFSDLNMKKEGIIKKELKDMLGDTNHAKVMQKEFTDYVDSRLVELATSSTYSNYKMNIKSKILNTIKNTSIKRNIPLNVSFDLYCKEMINFYQITRTIYDSLISVYKDNKRIQDSNMPDLLFSFAKDFEILQLKRIKSINKNNFALKENYEISIEEDIKFVKNAYISEDGFFQQKLSTPEQLFVKKYLEDSKSNILYWFKNFDNGADSLSFTYDINGELHLHTPDFICIDNNGFLKLYEVKENTTSETNSTINKAKFNALSDLVKDNHNKFSYDIIFVDSKQMLQMGHSQNKPI